MGYKSQLETLAAELRKANAAIERDQYQNRAASKASLIGGSQPFMDDGGPDLGAAQTKGRVAKIMKASLGLAYEPGALTAALVAARSADMEEQYQGKTALKALGVRRVEAPGYASVGKATLGVSGANGGYVLPNNLVASVVKKKTMEAFWPGLFKERTGVTVRGVDQPYRTTAAQRAAFIDWGNTKTNVSETYGTYSAVLGTLALIYDLGKQYLRFSAGAAEADAIDEITRGMWLAENYACAVGPGTGSVGTGDPTTGVYTALAAASPTYTSAFPGASSSTIAGSAASALAIAFGAMAQRSRMPTAVVMDAADFWSVIREGTDTAGFWVSPSGGPAGFTRTASGELELWNVPIYWDANLTSNGVPAKSAIVLDGEAFTFFRGLEFRVDVSDIAGDRFDQNTVGFRGEEEIAFNGSVGVAIGGAQLVTGILP